jgi:hypothetical protein
MAGIFLSSCKEDENTNYSTPKEYNLTSVISDNIEKQSNRTVFTVDFATEGVTGSNGQYSGTGNVLSIQFTGNRSYLPAGTFIPADEALASGGSYISGYGTNSGTCFYDVSGGTATPHLVSKGKLTVNKSGDDYTLSGYLWFDNDDAISVNCSGSLYYENNEPVTLTKVFAADVTPGDGVFQITLKLGTPDLTFAAADFATSVNDIYGGNGNGLRIEFVSADATLAPGTYTPAAATAGNGNYIIGYDYPVGMYDMWFYNLGTCWFTVENDTEKGTHIENGNITVEKDGSTYTITFDNGDISAQYKGVIEALSGGGDDNGGGDGELTNLFEASHSGSALSLKIHDGNLTPSLDLTTYTWKFSGTGTCLYLELYSANGTLTTGTYIAAESDVLSEFTYTKGSSLDLSLFGGEGVMYFGSCLLTVTDGVVTGQHIESGTITVSSNITVDGSGSTFTITVNNGEANPPQYTGKVKGKMKALLGGGL